MKLRFSILLFSAVSLGIVQVQASDLYWDADGDSTSATGGTGNWETSTSLWRSTSFTGSLGAWTNSGNNNDAILGGTAGTLTLTTGISVNDITVNPIPSGIYSITGAQTLTLNGAAQSALDVASGSTLTITSGLAGTNGFTKSSAGTLILDGAGGTNGLFGGISVTGGTLQAGSATNNGASQVLRSNAVNLAGGTSLTTSGTTIDLRVGSLSGSGSVTPATGGAINVLAREDATFSGVITTTGGLNLRGGNGTTQTFSGNLTGLTGTFGINSGATMKLTGAGDNTSGVIGGTTIALRGGFFVMDNSGGNTSASAGRISDSAAFTFLGGTLSLIGSSSGTSETVGAPTFSAGYNTISVTNNGGTGAQLTFTRAAGSWRDATGMVINFVGSGTGTLGSAGNNPRIISTGAPITITGGTSAPLGMFANTATGATVGWATVNGTEWAGYGANGVVALTPNATPTTAANLAALTATSMAVFSPTATVTASGAVTTGTLKITPNGGTTLSMGSNALTTTALMLAGTTDFAITGTGNFSGGAHKYVYVTDANTTLTMSQNMGGSNQGFTKAGPGFLSLNGTTLTFTNANNINLDSGVLRGTAAALGGATAAGGAFSSINFRGGVLELSGGVSFVRAIDLAGTASGGGVSFDNGGSDRGDGGFSAISGNSTVTLVTAIGGSTAASLVWNNGAFLSNGYVLTMGSTKADSRIDLTNAIGLDDGTATNSYFAREVRVADNTGSATDVARLSGVITGSANADLLKTGAGVLELTNTNTYSGNTLIQQGTLIATNGAAIANTSAVVLSNTAGATFQLNSSETIGAITGGGTTGGNVALQTNTLTVGDQRDSTFGGVISSTSSAGSLVKQGTGTLTLTNTNTYTGNTTVNAGKLVINGNISTSITTVKSGGTLGGSGTVGALTVEANGTVAPGNSPGILNAGNTNLQASSTLGIEIDGATVGTQYDQLNVTGTVSLAGLLTVTMGYTPADSALFFIIANDGLPTDMITGTFSNAPVNGGTYNLGGQDFKISYFGDSAGNTFTGGNDVVLMAIPEPATALLGGLGLLVLLRRRR